MVGMDFFSFLILLAISVVVVAAKTVAIDGANLDAASEVISDLAAAWVGSWLGSPVFGHWFEGVSYQRIYLIPAALGAIAALALKTQHDSPRAAGPPAARG